MKTVLKLRESNFELLRIISMLLIIAGHFAGQSGGMDNTTGLNEIFCITFGSGGRIAVNLFLMIGTWFMVDSEFKGSKIVSLYSSTWIYSVVFTILAILIDPTISKPAALINGLFPFIRLSLWFMTIYIELMLLAPFLKRLLLSFNQEQIRKIVLISFLFVVVMSTIRGISDTFLCSLGYFIFIYIFMWYFKKYLFDRIKISAKMLIISG